PVHRLFPDRVAVFFGRAVAFPTADVVVELLQGFLDRSLVAAGPSEACLQDHDQGHQTTANTETSHKTRSSQGWSSRSPRLRRRGGGLASPAPSVFRRSPPPV